MKEKVILVIVILLMIVLVGGATLVMNSAPSIDEGINKGGDVINSENDLNSVDKTNGDTKLKSGEENMDLLSGEKIEEVTINYVTDETFENEVIKSEKTVVVDFYADWCGPCKILAPILQEFANENPDIKVVKLNVDENETTAMNFSVYSIPTLVVIKDGVETNRLVGVTSKENIKNAVEFVKK